MISKNAFTLTGVIMSFKMFDRLLEQRREYKRKIASGEVELRLPTDVERTIMQYQMYAGSGFMGSKSTPLNRG